MPIDDTVFKMWEGLYDANDYLREFTEHFAMTPTEPHLGLYLFFAERDIYVAKGMHRLLEAASPEYADAMREVLEDAADALETYFDQFCYWDPFIRGYPIAEMEVEEDPDGSEGITFH